MYDIESVPIKLKPLRAPTSSKPIDYLSSTTQVENIDITKFKFEVRSYDLVCLQDDFKKFYSNINELISEKSDIFECLNIMKNEINDTEYRKFINHLISLINDHINTPSETILSPINFNSFKKFILFSLSKKVQKSEIRIDTKTGNFCLYHSDKNDHKSRKISLVFSEKDVVYSVISRDYGLAKISGRCVLKQPDANHKIDLLMDLFKF